MWIAPKTDWNADVDVNGNYIGDYFNASDYNRIKNNVEYIHGIAEKVYGTIPLTSMGEDKTLTDFIYADEMNLIEDNLNTISQMTIGEPFNEHGYEENGRMMTFYELNYLEGFIYYLCDKITNAFYGRHQMRFRMDYKKEVDF